MVWLKHSFLMVMVMMVMVMRCKGSNTSKGLASAYQQKHRDKALDVDITKTARFHYT